MRSFLFQVLEKNPENRLGNSSDGFRQIKHHQFFQSINFDDLLLKKYRPEFVPAAVSIPLFDIVRLVTE